MRMPSTKQKYCVTFIVDFVLLLAVALPILLFYYLAYPFQRGLYCNDEKIRFPYKDSTIPGVALFLVGIFLPLSVMCLVEWLRVRNGKVGKQFQLFGKPMNAWFRVYSSSAGVFLFGCAVSQLLTDIAKYSLGILRPHFISVCKPDWSSTNCTTNLFAFVDPIPCTTPEEDLDKLKDARLSFPSGHASFSAFTMIYLVIYLQMRLNVRGFHLLKPVLQLFCLLLTFYTSLTRISDYKHHWGDVLGGFVLGVIVAILVVVYVSDLFSESSTSDDKDQVVVLEDYQAACQT